MDADMRMALERMDARMQAGFEGMGVRFEGMDARFDRMDARFEETDARFDGMDARFDGMDARFEETDARMQAGIARMEHWFELSQAQHIELRDSTDAQFVSLRQDVARLDARLSAFHEEFRRFREWVAGQIRDLRLVLERLTARIERLERRQNGHV